MKLFLEKIIIQNFLSIGYVEFAFNNSGTVLIQGIVEGSSASESNGAGKTSIIEALNWVLFDDTIKGLSKDDVVNNKVGRDCFVKLIGKVNDNNFEITRYRKHKIEKNKIVFVYNNQDISESTDSKTNKKIEEVFKMNFSDFQTNIVFSSNSMKFLELGDTERKKIFDSIVKSDLYEKCIEKIKEKIKEKDSEYNSLNLQLEKLKSEQGVNEKRLIENENYKDFFDKKRQAEIVNINDKIKNNILLRDDFELKKKKEIDEISIKIKDKTTQLFELEKLNCKQILESLESRIQDTKKESEKISPNSPLEKTKEDINNRILELRSNSNNKQTTIINLKKEIERLNTDIEALTQKKLNYNESLKKDECPLCKQPIKDKEEVYIEFQKIDNEIDSFVLKINNIKKEVLENENDLNAIVEEGKKAKNTLLSIEADLNVHKEVQLNLIKSQNEKIDFLNKQKLEYSQKLYQAESISFEIENIKDSLTKKQNEKNVYIQFVVDLEKELKTKELEENTYIKIIEQIKNEVLENEKKQKDMEHKIKNLNIEKYKYWINGFKKIKGLLISTITPMMNEKAQEYSQILTNNEFGIRFITQRENKDGSIKDVFEIEVERQDGGNNYKSLSSGEKRRIDLITIFVLDELKRLNNVHDFNIRFYDEIFDSLDGIGKERVMDLLNIVSEDKQVFVISHKDDMKDLFNKSITIIKKNGISELLNNKIPIENTII